MPIPNLREGRDNLDIRMSLFCSSASLTNSFSPRVVQFLFNTSSLGSDAQETRQRDGFWRDFRGVVAKAWNDEDNIMQDLSALPELEITD